LVALCIRAALAGGLFHFKPHVIGPAPASGVPNAGLSGRGWTCAWRAGSSQGARIQTSRSSSVVKVTGIAFEWIGSTIAFGDVVKNP
jgi:hypothetical protein